MIHIDKSKGITEVHGFAKTIIQEFLLLSAVMLDSLPKTARGYMAQAMHDAVEFAEEHAEEHEDEPEAENEEKISDFLKSALKVFTEEGEE